MAYIPDNIIDEVRSSTDIVDVVSSYVQLKKRGRNYLGLCPFHKEKTPSFNVNPQMQIFKCFGCGVGGDVYQFVMGMERVEFPEAVRTLAAEAGIEIPERPDSAKGQSENEAIYSALSYAGRYFHEQLRSKSGAAALEYLVKDRGLTETTLVQFGIGYALNDWEAFVTKAQSEKLDVDVLKKAGLSLTSKEGKPLDRYRNRIMIPILSPVGKVLGFGGRWFGKDGDEAKYINSPETPVYHKSSVLYGLYWSKGEIRRREEAILVEGYTDVMGLFQAGVQNVVATCGTSLTQQQAAVLKRYCPTLLLLYDGDDAGRAAALRAIEVVLPEVLIPYVVTLPAEHDPDSFVKEVGRDGFESYVEKHKRDFLSFAFSELSDSSSLPEERARAQRQVIRLLTLIPDELVRESFIRRSADVLGLTEVQIRRELGRLRNRSRRQRSEVIAESRELPERLPVQIEHKPLPEEYILLRLMLEHGEPMVEQVLGNMALTEFTEGPLRETARRLLGLYEDGDIDPSHLLSGEAGDEVKDLVAGIMTREYEPSEHWQSRKIVVPKLDENAQKVASDAMRLLKLDRLKERIDHQREKILRSSHDAEKVAKLQEEMVSLLQAREGIKQAQFSDWNDV